MTPQTEAGRALLEGRRLAFPMEARNPVRDAILAIEREAAAQERERIRAAITKERASYQVGEMASYEYDLILDAEAAK